MQYTHSHSILPGPTQTKNHQPVQLHRHSLSNPNGGDPTSQRERKASTTHTASPPWHPAACHINDPPETTTSKQHTVEPFQPPGQCQQPLLPFMRVKQKK
ncbi:hypothetical protein AMECASPLE_023633 [Ameca splendens]|uniref:Uncharacterized protein n=1 Tax=Ameca splendens TaxID=208324 RepID=A0ABV1AD33_9TELE